MVRSDRHDERQSQIVPLLEVTRSEVRPRVHLPAHVLTSIGMTNQVQSSWFSIDPDLGWDPSGFEIVGQVAVKVGVIARFDTPLFNYRLLRLRL